MKTIEDSLRAADLPRNLIATVGNYDGIHRGQQEILRLVGARAHETGLKSALITFEPHPQAVLAPQGGLRRITTASQKETLIASFDIDYLLILSFDFALASTPARRFVRDFLSDRLAVREIYVGSRFVFGREREGDLSLLQAMGDNSGYTAFGVREVEEGGEAISSTRVRRAVTQGDVELAERMLGRPFSVTGIVARGAARGRELGWPTANLSHDNELLPDDGVYVTVVRRPGRDSGYPSITNVGVRPTLASEAKRLVESHLFDYHGDLYGERLEVEFRRRVRSERVFSSARELVSQIERDARVAREYFAAKRC